jgi:hypothetical protein
MALECLSSRPISLAEVESLIYDFEAGTLSRARWTHHAHLIVAMWYLVHHSEDVATSLIRVGIKRYNAAVGIANTPSTGYHETLTLLWIKLVSAFLRDRMELDPESKDLYNTMLDACGDSSIPFRYYRRERLFSAEARAKWVKPDLLPLP